jgi:hypothetical protein
MKNVNLSATSVDDERFDRLVDGDLSPEEYRSFVSALDEEPGAWRRCALAFLEAQALSSELGHIWGNLDRSQDTAPLHQAAALNKHAVRSQGKTIPWTKLLSALAIAASLVAALSLGIVAPQFFTRRGKESPLMGNLTTEPMMAPGMSGGGDRHDVLRPIGNVRLVMDGAEGSEGLAGNVPVYDAGVNLDEFLSRDDPVLGSDLVDLLRQYGYDVRHEQQYVPAPLDDGRQLIVPVDGYQITPVSRRY